MNKFKTKNSKAIEGRLEEIKKDFVKIIPQLNDIQETQKIYKEVQQKRIEEQYPFINTQTSSTLTF